MYLLFYWFHHFYATGCFSVAVPFIVEQSSSFMWICEVGTCRRLVLEIQLACNLFSCTCVTTRGRFVQSEWILKRYKHIVGSQGEVTCPRLCVTAYIITILVQTA